MNTRFELKTLDVVRVIEEAESGSGGMPPEAEE